MKYSLLSLWTKESQATRLKVDSVLMSETGIRCVFKDKQVLLLYCNREDSLPLWTKDSPPLIKEEAVWKQLSNAELELIRIADSDRIIYFHFFATDIYQQQSRFVLIAEFTPPQPNLILAKKSGDELVIWDAWKKYGYADNPQRQILPKLAYQPPVTGFKPIKEDVRLPLIVKPLSGGKEISCPSVNDYFIHWLEEVLLPRQRLASQKAQLGQWKKELAKAQNKLAKQQQELQDAEQAEHWKVCAETLKHNLQMISKGQAFLEAVNYFDPSLSLISIPLQADKTPKQNLQYYVKKYQKAKRGREIIAQNIAASTEAVSDLEDIVKRVAAGEDIPFRTGGGKNLRGKEPLPADKLLRLRISDDFEVVIGRKAKENDYLTTQLARPHDWWFHTRIYHGGHVLLRCLTKRNRGNGSPNCVAAWQPGIAGQNSPPMCRSITPRSAMCANPAAARADT